MKGLVYVFVLLVLGAGGIFMVGMTNRGKVSEGEIRIIAPPSTSFAHLQKFPELNLWMDDVDTAWLNQQEIPEILYRSDLGVDTMNCVVEFHRYRGREDDSLVWLLTAEGKYWKRKSSVSLRDESRTTMLTWSDTLSGVAPADRIRLSFRGNMFFEETTKKSFRKFKDIVEEAYLDN